MTWFIVILSMASLSIIDTTMLAQPFDDRGACEAAMAVELKARAGSKTVDETAFEKVNGKYEVAACVLLP